MPAQRLHFVRHAQVNNPDGVIYERIPGFGITDKGHQMAAAAAEMASKLEIAAFYCSPLQRAKESASHWERLYGVELMEEPRIIENWNKFRGLKINTKTLLQKPLLLAHFHDPFKPSWAEPYVEIQTRMLAAAKQAWDETDGGDVVFVSHQLPIVMLQRTAQGMSLPHYPKDRKCELSSISSFEFVAEQLTMLDYVVPWQEAGIEL